MSLAALAVALVLSTGTPTRVWRLTPAQYVATLEEVLGARIALSFGAPARQDSFQNNPRALEVNDIFLSDLEDGVRRVVAAEMPRIEAMVPCRTTACLGRFVRDFAGRAFRSTEVDPAPYLRLFAKLRPTLGRRDALQSVVVAILLSPKMLFRTELHATLTPSELAESLAYTLWNAPPDAQLRQHVTDRTLARPEVFRTEVERMLDAPAGRAGLREFVLQWAGLGSFSALEKSPRSFPEFKDLKRPMIEETTRFVDQVLDEQDGRFVELLARADSSALYQSEPGGTRIGLFTQPAVLSAISDSSLTGLMYRAKFLLDRLVCIDVPPPVDVKNVKEFNEILKEAHADTAVPLRDRLEELEYKKACKSCHSLLHPLAFPMENYDPIGRYRTKEHDLPIDPSGTITMEDGTEIAYKNAVEMFRALAGHPLVERCFARHAFRYVFGRQDNEGDASVVDRAFRDGRRDGQLAVRELFTSLLDSDAFKTRELK